MAHWVKDVNGHALNLDNAISLSVGGSGTERTILVDFGVDDYNGTVQLAGTWTSEAAAEAAIAKLVHSFDPSGL